MSGAGFSYSSFPLDANGNPPPNLLFLSSNPDAELPAVLDSSTRLTLISGSHPSISTAAYHIQPAPIDYFHTSFTFQISRHNNEPKVAEGFTFVITNTLPDSPGKPGPGLGYAQAARSTPSFAISLNINQHGGHNRGCGFSTNNTSPKTYNKVNPVALSGSPPNPIQTNVVYFQSIGVLFLHLLDTVTHDMFHTSHRIDLSQVLHQSNAYVGFTASTGKTTAAINISDWHFNVFDSRSRDLFPLNACAADSNANLDALIGVQYGAPVELANVHDDGPVWITLDMGAPIPVYGINIQWYNTGEPSPTYQCVVVQVSQDKQTWETVFNANHDEKHEDLPIGNDTFNPGGPNGITYLVPQTSIPIMAQFIRVWAKASNTGAPVRIIKIAPCIVPPPIAAAPNSSPDQPVKPATPQPEAAAPNSSLDPAVNPVPTSALDPKARVARSKNVFLDKLSSATTSQLSLLCEKLNVSSLKDGHETKNDGQSGSILAHVLSVNAKLSSFLNLNKGIFHDIFGNSFETLYKQLSSGAVIVGSQKAGKSSLIETLMGLPLAFTNHLTATRCAVHYLVVPDSVPNDAPIAIAQLSRTQPVASMTRIDSETGQQAQLRDDSGNLYFDMEQVNRLVTSVMKDLESRNEFKDELRVNIYVGRDRFLASNNIDLPGLRADGLDNTTQVRELSRSELAEEIFPPDASKWLVIAHECHHDSTSTSASWLALVKGKPCTRMVLALTKANEVLAIKDVVDRVQHVRNWKQLALAFAMQFYPQFGLTETDYDVDPDPLPFFLTYASGWSSDKFWQHVASNHSYEAAVTEWKIKIDKNREELIKKLNQLVAQIPGFDDDPTARDIFISRHVGTHLLKVFLAKQQLKSLLKHLNDALSLFVKVELQITEEITRIERLLSVRELTLIEHLSTLFDQFHYYYHCQMLGSQPTAPQLSIWSQGIKDLPQEYIASLNAQTWDQYSKSKVYTMFDDLKLSRKNAHELRVGMHDDVDIKAILEFPYNPNGNPPTTSGSSSSVNETTFERLLNSPYLDTKQSSGLQRLSNLQREMMARMPHVAPLHFEKSDMLMLTQYADAGGVAIRANINRRLTEYFRALFETRLNPYVAHRQSVIVWHCAMLAFEYIRTHIDVFRHLLDESTDRGKQLYEDIKDIIKEKYYTENFREILDILNEKSKTINRIPDHHEPTLLEMAIFYLGYDHEQVNQWSRDHMSQKLSVRMQKLQQVQDEVDTMKIESKINFFPPDVQAAPSAGSAPPPIQGSIYAWKGTDHWPKLQDDDVDSALLPFIRARHEIRRCDPGHVSELILGVIDENSNPDATPDMTAQFTYHEQDRIHTNYMLSRLCKTRMWFYTFEVVHFELKTVANLLQSRILTHNAQYTRKFSDQLLTKLICKTLSRLQHKQITTTAQQQQQQQQQYPGSSNKTGTDPTSNNGSSAGDVQDSTSPSTSPATGSTGAAAPVLSPNDVSSLLRMLSSEELRLNDVNLKNVFDAEYGSSDKRRHLEEQRQDLQTKLAILRQFHQQLAAVQRSLKVDEAKIAQELGNLAGNTA